MVTAHVPERRFMIARFAKNTEIAVRFKPVIFPRPFALNGNLCRKRGRWLPCPTKTTAVESAKRRRTSRVIK